MAPLPFAGIISGRSDCTSNGVSEGGTQSMRKGCESGKNFTLPKNNTRYLKYFRKKRQAIILIPLVLNDTST